MTKGEKWRRRTYAIARILEANGRTVRARALDLAIIADAKLEAGRG